MVQSDFSLLDKDRVSLLLWLHRLVPDDVVVDDLAGLWICSNLLRRDASDNVNLSSAVVLQKAAMAG